MPAYFVYVCQEVLDRAKLEAYWREIVPTLQGYGARSLSSYAPFEQLEGEPVEAVVVVEFPSRERAREWYDSDAYKAIRHLRIEGARYIGVLAEGGTPPIDQRMPRTRGVRPAPNWPRLENYSRGLRPEALARCPEPIRHRLGFAAWSSYGHTWRPRCRVSVAGEAAMGPSASARTTLTHLPAYGSAWGRTRRATSGIGTEETCKPRRPMFACSG